MSSASPATAYAPDLQMPSVLGLAPSFGFGDRIGLATPGHVAALRHAGAGIMPIFAQQSIREMTRTARTPRQVMDDALRGAMVAGYRGKGGADADHLKTPEDVDRTAAVGFCFFTIDPSEHVDPQADNYTPAQLAQKFGKLVGEVDWLPVYRNRTIRLTTGTEFVLDEATCLRAAVKYGRALNMALSLAEHIEQVMTAARREYEIELSVDETPQPTTLAEHFIIADQCLTRGMKLLSLAPRFIGDFEKGVDYKGDIAALERSLADHAAIAKMLGPYKLSLHSGSDKLSIYTALARATQGVFHVKTAGTSYLEALRVVARHDAALFARIIDFSRQRYDTDRATYHLSATLNSAPPPSEMAREALESTYLGGWANVPTGAGFTEPARQILHCTFGSVLMHDTFKNDIRQILAEHPQTYVEVLQDHFSRHLAALAAGM